MWSLGVALRTSPRTSDCGIEAMRALVVLRGDALGGGFREGLVSSSS